MRGINSETVDLIATDPPFNKGRDFHATPESVSAGAKFQDRWSWERDVHEEWVDQIKDDFPAVYEVIDAARSAYGDDMGAFLCFLGVRLIEMHRVLKPTGSIYLHCDPTASHYIKTMMDGIFGRKQFKNEIIWHYHGGRKPKVAFGRKHDVIFFYTKEKKYTYHQQRQPAKDPSQFRKIDENGDRYQVDGHGRVYYLKDGQACTDVWTWVQEGAFHSLHSQSRERTGYPTQKPLALYERIIKASSNPGDVVLDPFCGCATTPIAAERQGRQWIGMDLWEKAHEVVLQRLNKEANVGEGKGEGFNLYGEVYYETTPPIRTDEVEANVPDLAPIYKRNPAPWEKLSRQVMFDTLAEAQGREGEVVCAGCGISLDSRYFHLDHITPRADRGRNTIDNRILLCGPCNGVKSNTLTLSGLVRRNKKEGWIKNADMLEWAQERAHREAERVRFEMV